MQRLLSLITLGVLGGLGYLFLQGGGLDQLVVPQTGEQEQQQQGGYVSPGPWQASTSQGTSQQTNQPASRQPTSNPVATGGNGNSLLGNVIRNRSTITIASFNIQVFGNKKASKPYVMKDLADIINLFDVIAIQEVRSKNEYLIPQFVQLVNQSGRRFDYVLGPRLGISNSKEQYVFLYDTQKIEIDRQSIYTVSDPDGLLHREPLVATFRSREVDPDKAFTFTLVNMHTDYDIAEKEMDVLADVYRAVRRAGGEEDDIIMLGDFNVDDRHLGRLGKLPGIRPLIEGVWTNTRQTKQYDNLIVHQPSTAEYSGNSGVFNFMRAKNRSLKQAVQISDHFPVWAEFSVYERDYSGRIASHSARRRMRR